MAFLIVRGFTAAMTENMVYGETHSVNYRYVVDVNCIYDSV